MDTKQNQRIGTQLLFFEVYVTRLATIGVWKITIVPLNIYFDGLCEHNGTDCYKIVVFI